MDSWPATIWFAGVAFLWLGRAYLMMGMFNNPATDEGRRLSSRWPAFRTNAADFNEAGQKYRRWSIQAEIAVFVWSFAGLLIVANLPRM